MLFIDIETAPIKGYSWQLFDTNVLHVIEPTYLLSFSYKWGHEKKVSTLALPDFKGYKPGDTNDRELLHALACLLNICDIAIAHNGDGFDFKKINSRLLTHNIAPPRPYKTVDTLKIARRYFKFDSNKLDNLGRYLGVGQKLAHIGKDLWLGCMAGDAKCWATMKRYNAQDVRLLEAVYLKLAPWHATHPDLTMYGSGQGCPLCQSMHYSRQGVKVNRTRRAQQFKCCDCGHWWSRGVAA